MWISLISIRQFVMGSAGMGSLLIVGLPSVWADCPDCQKGTISPAPTQSVMPMQEHPMPSQPGDSDLGMPRQPFTPAPQGEQLMRPAYAVLPPPGTLGQTYLRQSWPIPNDEHPRTAIIQIAAPGFTELEMEGLEDMEGFQRQDGLWIFKTKRPLTPGIPHIYQVKAGDKNAVNKHWDVRTVRLIPGRVVTLEY